MKEQKKQRQNGTNKKKGSNTERKTIQKERKLSALKQRK